MRSDIAPQAIATPATTPGTNASAARPVASHRAPATRGTTNAVAYWMVKMAALMEATSPGGATRGGRLSTTTKASAVEKPRRKAQATTPVPGVNTIPAWATAIRAAEPTKPPRPVNSLGHSATAGAVSSWEPLSTARAGEIRSWRPVWSRKSGMYALAPKYVADAIPITSPIRTAWWRRHSGHQRPPSETPAARAGAYNAMATALTSTKADHEASAHRQSPCASASAPTGVVKAVGSVSPIRIP